MIIPPLLELFPLFQFTLWSYSPSRHRWLLTNDISPLVELFPFFVWPFDRTLHPAAGDWWLIVHWLLTNDYSPINTIYVSPYSSYSPSLSNPLIVLSIPPQVTGDCSLFPFYSIYIYPLFLTSLLIVSLAFLWSFFPCPCPCPCTHPLHLSFPLPFACPYLCPLSLSFPLPLPFSLSLSTLSSTRVRVRTAPRDGAKTGSASKWVPRACCSAWYVTTTSISIYAYLYLTSLCVCVCCSAWYVTIYYLLIFQ